MYIFIWPLLWAVYRLISHYMPHCVYPLFVTTHDPFHTTCANMINMITGIKILISATLSTFC